MKKGENPELSARWWKTSQPKDLSSGGKVELALRAHETAVAGFRKEPTKDRLAAALDALDQVKDAVQKAIAEAGKAKGNAEMEFTVQALRKIDFAREIKQLESEVKKGGEEDEEDSAALGHPAEYAKMLRRALAKVGSEPRNWGFLAGKKPSDHRFLLHQSQNGRNLATAAAKQLGRAAKVSFGTCIRSPDDDATIILTVQGAMLAGLATRIRKMLVAMKPQAVSDVLLMVDGKIVPEAFDPGDVDEEDQGDAQVENPELEALHRRIAVLEPRAAAVMEALPDYRDRLRTSIDQMMAAMAKEDVATAGRLLGKLEEVIARLATANPPTATGATAPAVGDLRAARDSFRLAAEKIVAAIAKADAQVRKLQAFLAVHPDPQLREIAGSPDLGINALTGGHRVRVLAVLEDLRNTPDERLPAVLARARKIVGDFNQHVRTSERIAACDQNSFGIAVNVRPVLEPVLTEVTRSIAQAAA